MELKQLESALGTVTETNEAGVFNTSRIINSSGEYLDSNVHSSSNYFSSDPPVLTNPELDTPPPPRAIGTSSTTRQEISAEDQERFRNKREIERQQGITFFREEMLTFAKLGKTSHAKRQHAKQAGATGLRQISKPEPVGPRWLTMLAVMGGLPADVAMRLLEELTVRIIISFFVNGAAP
jgi:hypothetical protein